MRTVSTAHQTLKHLRSQGVVLYLDGDSLRFRAPRALTPSEREAVRRDREEIVELVREADRWRLLAESGKTDMDVVDLDEALFLFALHKMREESAEAVKAYIPWWKKRLLPGALEYLNLS